MPDLKNLHIICERDVGFFSLFQQVVANIPWAAEENRIPVVYFSRRCSYWTPEGYEGCYTVWEYYFEPVVDGYSVNSIPENIKEIIDSNFPEHNNIGYLLDDNIWISNNYGEHPDLKGKALAIPHMWDDPDKKFRKISAGLIRKYVRPRSYILKKVDNFFDNNMRDFDVIGVHVRGTDAVSADEPCPFRKGSLVLENYAKAIRKRLTKTPDARIFVATDDQNSLDYLRGVFGKRVIAYESLRHQGGEAAGRGPTGWLMPAYITGNRSDAARNGEEAVIEYLLLCRCQHLIHNGASLARTVLLSQPELEFFNVHQKNKFLITFRLLNHNPLIINIVKSLKILREILHIISRLLKKKSIGWISADPNPIYLCTNGTGRGVTKLSWWASKTNRVEVRLNSPNGNLFSSSTSKDTGITGQWVHDGMTFYLQDASAKDPCAPENTLSKVSIRVIEKV